MRTHTNTWAPVIQYSEPFSTFSCRNKHARKVIIILLQVRISINQCATPPSRMDSQSSSLCLNFQCKVWANDIFYLPAFGCQHVWAREFMAWPLRKFKWNSKIDAHSPTYTQVHTLKYLYDFRSFHHVMCLQTVFVTISPLLILEWASEVCAKVKFVKWD